eukprot:TRINITY_DN39103_c0_g1_i1.p1 TRINITY_DN39103_c0_g1~~TRINITY_DN39103_c0_g1_i1.p1  ORF type:complete len:1092 (+),score=346.27 TRINITY_DN39103_c0_g1_i1:348-3278(+)
MANVTTATSEASCEAGLKILKELVSTLQADIVGSQQALAGILQGGLSAPNNAIKSISLCLVCEIVTETEKKAWAPLLGTCGVLVQVLTQLAQAKEEEKLQTCIQAFIDVATIEPDFFKAQLQSSMEPAKFMASVARERQADTGLRGLALEFLVTYLEKRHKWLNKNVQNFGPLVMEACMDLMLEVEDGNDALKEWAERMDDEEGEEDEDELFHSGEESIDRIVEAVGMDLLGPALFKLIGHFTSQPSWQAKHAALAAVKQTVEYVEDTSHMQEMAKLLIGSVDHEHPRVRYTALHAIGQLANDQAPQFQEMFHQTVMPILLKKMDDPVDRVAAMSMSAFVSFGEELDNALMAGYARGVMEKLVLKLQSSQHRGVREEAITSIAVIAGVIEKDFSQYYDSIMPMLKQFILHAKGDKEQRLRGKSFECMSLLGLAVGKEKFGPDAQEAVAEMLKTPLDADDVQREYIKEASERICQCLKKDFAPFLQHLLPNICKSLSFEALAESGGKVGGDDDDDEYIAVQTGDGKMVKVRTSNFEEMMSSVQQLHTFVTEMESGFFDYVQDTAKVLHPLLNATDEMSMLCDEIRGSALNVWAGLIKAARLGAKERNMPNDLVKQLFQSGIQASIKQVDKCGSEMEGAGDCDVLAELACGMTECIKGAGPGVLAVQEILQLAEKMFALIDESFKRSAQSETEKAKAKAEGQSLPQELKDDDDDDEDAEGVSEEQLRRNYEEVLGALMEVAPSEFMQVLGPCAQRIQQWVTKQETKVLGLYLACDLLNHLKDQSESAWPVFMPCVFSSLQDKDPDARTASAYAVNLAAPLAKFAEAAPDAFKQIAQVLNASKPKKRDDKGKVARDNAVAAMLSLAKEKAALCPPDVQAWDLVIDRLPLRDDEDEAKSVHEKIVKLTLEQNAGLMGPGQKNLGRVLAVLAEIYKTEGICTKDLDVEILKIFKALPQNVLASCAGGLTEKQQKKIEKMLS